VMKPEQCSGVKTPSRKYQGGKLTVEGLQKARYYLHVHFILNLDLFYSSFIRTALPDFFKRVLSRFFALLLSFPTYLLFQTSPSPRTDSP
jgi:hypothetical protein